MGIKIISMLIMFALVAAEVQYNSGETVYYMLLALVVFVVFHVYIGSKSKTTYSGDTAVKRRIDHLVSNGTLHNTKHILRQNNISIVILFSFWAAPGLYYGWYAAVVVLAIATGVFSTAIQFTIQSTGTIVAFMISEKMRAEIQALSDSQDMSLEAAGKIIEDKYVAKNRKPTDEK